MPPINLFNCLNHITNVVPVGPDADWEQRGLPLYFQYLSPLGLGVQETNSLVV